MAFYSLFLGQRASTTPATTPSVASWLPNFGRPVRAINVAALIASGGVLPPLVAETITVDKWFSPVSVPQRKPALASGEQQFLAFVKAAPFPEATTVDRWHQPLSKPVPPAPRYQLATSLTFPPLPVVSYGWFGSISAPARAKAAAPNTPFYTANLVFEVSTSDKWFRPLSEPVRLKPTALNTPFYTANLVIEVTTPDKWLRSLSEPVRIKSGLSAAANPWLAFVKAAPFGETITADKWLYGLSVPAKLSRLWVLPALQPTTVSDPFPPSPPPPPPPPPPGVFTVSGEQVWDQFPTTGVAYTYAAITKRTN